MDSVKLSIAFLGIAASPPSLASKRQNNTCHIGDVAFNTALCRDTYALESVEVVTPISEDAHTILLYNSGASAATAYSGTHRTIVMGFPFEAITDSDTRDHAMAKSLQFLMSKKRQPKVEAETERPRKSRRPRR